MSRARHKANTGATKGPALGTAYAGGASNVVKEAKERKRGGKVMGEGEACAPRSDKPKRARGGAVTPGRKRGGAVGADSHPLSSAATITHKDEISS